MNDPTPQTLADQLTSTERERRWPNVRPADAATLIILDRRRSVPQVLMGRRHAGHRFMPGKFVFPGGRIEAVDRRMPAANALNKRAEAAMSLMVGRPSPARNRALALAAIRETFEETGLMIGTKDYGAPEIEDGGPWGSFREQGIFPDLEALQFVARAITPPRRPKRFDTRFFAVDRTAVVHEVPGVTGPDSELVELVWVDLPKARELDLPAITTVILQELEARLAAGFIPELPVPFYREVRGRFVREAL
ncbi:NUDIX hydrolase [Salinarimonas soli]|uniref:NUDIX hydrolase n=1 Tax=Salinarimonas soli TaxID=1638099 RepID=A0A5B2W162_9HYPH|nr:NUDIX domain-containing protein [Salinarimonas soli]KAA2243959.1 NUDIX hydrolase [Salinarimonas soli]